MSAAERRFLVFAGTTEGRVLSEYLAAQGERVTACTATEYGKSLLEEGECLSVVAERMDQQQMEALMRNKDFACVLDATHPYAVLVTRNIQRACEATGTRYVRLLREETAWENCTYLKDTAQAAEYLKSTEGNVLLTTGSKELSVFAGAGIADYEKRLFARVLPLPEVMAGCFSLGFTGKNLIAMQGPFSEELNYQMLIQMNARYLVTKESGDAGGFGAKLRAAARAGAEVILIGRPEEKVQGLSFQKVIALLSDEYNIKGEVAAPVEEEVLYSSDERKTAGLDQSAGVRPEAEAEAGRARSLFPMFTDIAGWRVKVFGGGRISARRIASILQFRCRVEVVATKMGSELLELCKTFSEAEEDRFAGKAEGQLAGSGEGRLVLHERPYAEGDCAGADLVIAATDDRAVNRRIGEACRHLGIPVNISDRKEECSFYFPGVVRQGPLVIGVTASGEDHRLARKVTGEIRRLLEEMGQSEGMSQ